MSKDILLKGFSKEQIEKARSCHNQEELLALAKAEGIELNDEQLAAVSGGGCVSEEQTGFVCPNCQSTNTRGTYDDALLGSRGGFKCRCDDCCSEFVARYEDCPTV